MKADVFSPAWSGQMIQTMRWFGPADPVSLADIRQAGATGVVTALHDIPNGEVWPKSEIEARRALIEGAGMDWKVVESLPVDERIKLGKPGWEALAEIYCESLRNLAACGVEVVTYNFMPVLDWTRTDLSFAMPDGALALRFDIVALAAFDLHILNRPKAERDYGPDVRAQAARLYQDLSQAGRDELERTIIAGLPGSEEQWDRDRFLEAISAYGGISPDQLRANHIAFLEAVCPQAEALGIRLVVHPDDPPFPLFGLPRVVSTEADLAGLFDAVPSSANGLCFCVGSLGARPDNDLVAMIERFGSRIGFLHLRDVSRTGERVFHEAAHLEGDADMFTIMLALHRLAKAEVRRIPMRPDHGHQMLDDLTKVTNPGYSAIGRLKGLAELRGLELGIARLEALNLSRLRTPTTPTR